MTLAEWIHNFEVPVLLTVGLMTFVGLFFGKLTKLIKLPSIIGFMVVGVLLGPSLAGLLNTTLVNELDFITEVALAFVAVSIGLELKMRTLRQQGKAIIAIIITETLLAFALVATAVTLLTGNLALGLLFGGLAPASAPAGTVAIIQEYKARGSLTKALYSVVGFDDGVGIIIFGFAAAVSRSILQQQAGGEAASFLELIAAPLLEVILSITVGVIIALIFGIIARRMRSKQDIFILLFATVLIVCGLSVPLHLSLILTNMVIGFVIVNTQPGNLIRKFEEELQNIMPLFFVMFFVLAGANLHIAALPSLGALGVVYIISRSVGLTGGAALGGAIGRAEPKLRKYLGMGILSQAGVAIGLALIVKHEFAALGPVGMEIGSTIITTVTATSIFFELIGPILAKVGLQKAGEINAAESDSGGE
jgi:Kef-type K+ transport system membrane component KefB